jgi:hypothetical protein
METIGIRKLLSLMLLWPCALLADESKIQLKAGPGKDLVMRNCTTCHSVDYIQMNSMFMDKTGWEKTVNKMINVMGAPISPGDAQNIIQYLTAKYGTP